MRKGFRQSLSLFRCPEVKLTMAFFLTCLVLVAAIVTQHVMSHPVGVGVMSIAAAPAAVAIKLKKDGLTGDNLKAMEELEKRFEATVDVLTKEQIELEIRKMVDAANEAIKGVDFAKIKEMLGEDDKGIRSILLAQGKEITALKEGGGKREDLSIRGQVMAWQTRHKEVIAKIKSGERCDIPALELRVASPMTPANTYNGSAYLPRPEIEAGIIDLVRIAPTFWDYVTKGRTSSALYVWVNKVNPLGAAAFIGPGVAKPGISFELQTESSAAKKIAVSDKLAIELLDDIEGMTSYVEQELKYQLEAKTNTTLMTGTLSSTVPAGIQTISVPFSQTGLSTDNPNNMDAVRSIVAQLRVGNFGTAFGPITVFINPVDAANMDMSKATTAGVYILPPFTTSDGRQIAGATVVEDNNVAIGYVQAAILSLFKVKIYKDFALTWGWENDDFTKNLVTVIAERRLHSYHSANHAGAFIYDTFANIKALIASA